MTTSNTTVADLGDSVALGGLGGYMAPTIWLKTKISKNQRTLTEGLADALDGEPAH